MKQTPLSEHKLKNATVRLLTENIIENYIHDNSSVEVEDVRAIKEVNLKLTEGKPYCILVDSGMVTTISSEARKLSASKEFAQKTIAKALLVHSVGHRLVGRFYIKINKPHIKTKIFSDREDAIDWLKEQLKTVN